MTVEQYKQYMDIMHQWLIICEEGRHLDKFFADRGYRTIAIYGMGIYGRHLIRDLANTDIDVIYGIDRNPVEPYMGVAAQRSVQAAMPVDVVVNTVIREHDSISSELKKVTDIPVVSLEEVVYESY